MKRTTGLIDLTAKSVSISAADRVILSRLQEDCRLTNQQLAEQANMSASSCWRRVQSLEDAKVIVGYVARVDAKRAGFGFSAIVNVKLSRHSTAALKDFIREIRRRPEVLQCFALTGDADFMLRVVAEDMAAYTTFLNDVLFRLEGVNQVNTSVVMEIIKDDLRLPL